LTVGFARVPSATGADASVAVDIEIAFDTTGSMAPSLDAARKDAQTIVEGIRGVAPNVRFAVVSFRDHDNPGGEYRVVQPMTTSLTALNEAFAQLKAVSNPSPTNLDVESYNLAFHRSYADTGLGWRADSRKIVVVVGDAEPYGGGTANIAGCRDTHPDPDGFNVRTELDNMRAAERTLVMVRAISSNTTASLQCYTSLASLTYPGGTAHDSSNSNDIIAPLLGLVRSAVAPISIVPSPPIASPNSKLAIAIKLRNPNSAALGLQNLVLTLPAGVIPIVKPVNATIAGGKITWNTALTLAPRAVKTMNVRLRTDGRKRSTTLSAVGSFTLLPSGGSFSSATRVPLRVSQTVKVQTIRAARTKTGVDGFAKVTLRNGGSWNSASGTKQSGLFTVRTGPMTLTIRPTAFTASLIRGHALLRFDVQVVRGDPAFATCVPGANGRIVLSDHAFGLAAGGNTVAVSVPGCGLSRRWSTQSTAIRAA
jgi:hypothetical protein